MHFPSSTKISSFPFLGKCGKAINHVSITTHNTPPLVAPVTLRWACHPNTHWLESAGTWYFRSTPRRTWFSKKIKGPPEDAIERNTTRGYWIAIWGFWGSFAVNQAASEFSALKNGILGRVTTSIL